MAVTKERRKETMAAYYLRHKDSIRTKQNEYDKTRKKEKKQYYIDNNIASDFIAELLEHYVRTRLDEGTAK